jgi:hypothetical protein
MLGAEVVAGSSEVGVALAAGVVTLRAGGGVVGSGTPSGQCPMYVSLQQCSVARSRRLTVVAMGFARCCRSSLVIVFFSCRSSFDRWRGGWLRDAIRAVP